MPLYAFEGLTPKVHADAFVAPTATLDEVRRARRRIADGSYGTCEVCGEPIPAARLEARPWANRCVEHS